MRRVGYSDLTDTEYLYGYKSEKYNSMLFPDALKSMLIDARNIFENYDQIENKTFEQRMRQWNIENAISHNEYMIHRT